MQKYMSAFNTIEASSIVFMDAVFPPVLGPETYDDFYITPNLDVNRHRGKYFGVWEVIPPIQFT